jgi:hypothetical protein
MTRLMLAVTLTALSLGHRASAQTDIRESETVTLKLPTVFLSPAHSALLETRPTYVVDLVEEVGRIGPRGAPQWRTAGFPDLGRFEVSKVRRSDHYTEVELKSEARVVKLRFLPSVRDVGAAFADVTAPGPPDGSEARAYLESLFPLLTKVLLEGEVTHLPDTVQVGLVRAIHGSGGQARLATETYRDRSYLVVRLGSITPRAPLFLANPVARAAIVMNDQILAIAKRFWKPLGAGAGFDGLKIEADLPRARTAERVEEGSDRLEWYAPWPELSRFATDEITSAALLEKSVVLLEHNRVALPLDVAR